MRHRFPLVAIMVVVIAGCPGFNEAELARNRAEAAAAHAELARARAELESVKADLEGARLASQKAQDLSVAELNAARAEVKTLRAAQALVNKSDGHGPRIQISANGKPFLDQNLRDNEEVAPDQLGNYLSRLNFESNSALKITPSPADVDNALVKAKFELRVYDRRRRYTVLTMELDELRLGRSKANRSQWFLTREGIELIEQAYLAKSKP